MPTLEKLHPIGWGFFVLFFLLKLPYVRMGSFFYAPERNCTNPGVVAYPDQR